MKKKLILTLSVPAAIVVIIGGIIIYRNYSYCAKPPPVFLYDESVLPTPVDPEIRQRYPDLPPTIPPDPNKVMKFNPAFGEYMTRCFPRPTSSAEKQQAEKAKKMEQAISKDNRSIAVFDKEKNIHLYPILKNKKAYYLKNGDVWVMDFRKQQPQPHLLLDVEKDILTFDVSNDEKLLAYSLRKIDLQRGGNDPLVEDELFRGKSGDTIIVKNLYDSTEHRLYFDRERKNFQIRSILFSPNAKRLFFSTDYLWSIDLVTRKVKKYDAKELHSCGVYFLGEFSYDGTHVLAKDGCYEGSFQIVLNTVTGKAERKFSNGYVEGGIMVLGFVTNDSLLAYDDTGNKRGKIGVYSLSGKLIKQIRESGSYPLFFDNISIPDKIFISLSSSRPVIKDQSFYELDKSTFTLREFTEKRELAIIAFEEDGEKQRADFWVTNSDLENPVLFDSLEEDSNLILSK